MRRGILSGMSGDFFNDFYVANFIDILPFTFYPLRDTISFRDLSGKPFPDDRRP